MKKYLKKNDASNIHHACAAGIGRRPVRYYKLQYSELGRNFKEEARKAALRIAEYPKAWSIERGDVRKCVLHKFPYKLLYSVEKDYILIIAVAHQHRKPDYWVAREER